MQVPSRGRQQLFLVTVPAQSPLREQRMAAPDLCAGLDDKAGHVASKSLAWPWQTGTAQTQGRHAYEAHLQVAGLEHDLVT